MPDGAVLLLSLKPRYAEMFMAGRKSIEVRRTRPTAAAAGTKVIIYSSSPTMAVVAVAQIGAITQGPHEEIWETVGHQTGISKVEYETYVCGANQAVAIEIRGVRPFAEPVRLAEMRRRQPGFSPPQSFRYLDAAEADALISA